MVKTYDILGIVLRSENSGEKDKRLTVYSKEKGIIYAKVKGARDPKNKWSSSFEPGSLIFVTIYDKNNFKTVIKAQEKESFPNIKKDLLRSSYLYLILDTIENISLEGAKDDGVFENLFNAIKNLEKNIDIKVIDLKFSFDLLKHLGYQPDFIKCQNCNENLDPAYYDTVKKVFLCKNCKSENSILFENIELQFLRELRNLDIHLLKQKSEIVKKIYPIIKDYFNNYLEPKSNVKGFLDLISYMSKNKEIRKL